MEPETATAGLTVAISSGFVVVNTGGGGIIS